MEKQRLYWRCRRGMLELDCLLNDFLDSGYEAMAEQDRNAFLSLLDYPDAVLYDLLLGRSVTSNPEIAHVIEQIRSTPSH